MLATPALAQVEDIAPPALPTEEGNPFGDIDPSQFSDYYDNPEAFDACPDPAHCESMLDLLDSQQEIDVDAYRQSLDGFLNRDDPMSIVGDALGSEAVCDKATGDIMGEETVVEEYTCHSSFETTEFTDSCTVPLNVYVDEDYEYSCDIVDEEFCTPVRQNRKFILADIWVDYGDYYVDGETTDTEEQLFQQHIEVPGCWVSYDQFYEEVDIQLEYNCSSSVDVDNVSLPSGVVKLDTVDCTGEGSPSGVTCETLEATAGCAPSGEAYCDAEGGSSYESLHCVPDGQTVDGLSCERELVHELEVSFSYDCNYIYDEESGELTPDPKCVDLLGDESCSLTDSECVQNADTQFEEVSCQIGYALTYEDLECVADRYGKGFEEFLFSGLSSFSADTQSFSADADLVSLENTAGCTLESETCITVAPETFEDQSCREGYEDRDTSFECVITRDITVDTDYIYGTRRTWDAQAETHLAADSFKPMLEASCRFEGESCEVETPPSYSEHICLIGYRLNDTEEVCQLDRVITVDTDYGYAGLETYNYDSAAFVKNVAFVTLDGENECSVLDRTCTRESVPQYEQLTCEVGFDYDAEIVELTRPRVVEVDTDFLYYGFSNYQDPEGFIEDAQLTTLKVTDSCNLVEEICTIEGDGVFSTHECREGYTEVYNDRQCEVPLVVNTDSDYVYQASELWNTSSFTPESELIALRNANICTMQDRTCVVDSPGVFEDYSCDVGYERTYTETTFRRDGVPQFDTDYYYFGGRTWNGYKNAALQALEADNTCNFVNTVCTTPTPPPYAEYTCTQGYEDVVSDMSCVRERLVEVDLDYTYTVNRSWDTSTEQWTGQSDWNAVRSTAAAAASCQKTSETCSADSPGVYTQHTCEQGYTIEDESMSCAYELGFEVETDYRYIGYDTWNGSSFVDDTTLVQIGQQASSKSCTRESIVNELPLSTAQLTSKYVCLSGTITYDSSSTCSVSRNVTVGTQTRYKYEASEFSEAHDEFLAASDCEVTGGRQVNWPEPHLIFEYTCSNTHSGIGATYLGSTSQQIVTSDVVNTSGCSAQINAGESMTNEVCTEGQSTKNIDGLPVSRSCWTWSRTYGSSEVQSVNSCLPPSGFVYKRQTAFTGVPAVGTARSLFKKEYEKVESLANAVNILEGTTCLSGYWDTSSGQRKSYSCGQPSGSSQRSKVCAWTDGGGTCRLWAYSHTQSNGGPPGGYARHKEQWKCDLQVTGSGVAAPQVLTSHKNWIWWESNTCVAAKAQYPEGCTLDSQGYLPAVTTKTVDGHSITRQFSFGQNYTCGVRENVDTCSALLAENEYSDEVVQYASLELDLKLPGSRAGSVGNNSPPEYLQLAAVGDYTYDGQTCINYEGTTCTLWEKRYDREEVDGSGGCLTQEETYFCEEAISGAGTPAISRHVSSNTWQWPSPDCQAKFSDYDSCVYQGQANDTSTAETRVINGLSVYQSSWQKKRDYICTSREHTNTCNPPADATVENTTCLWQDSNNICRLAEYLYHEPLDDPTNGCSAYRDNYLCETRNHGTQYDTRLEYSHMAYPISTEQRAAINSSTCSYKSGAWLGGREARTHANGVTYTPGPAPRSHYLEQTYRCYEDEQIDTCNVPENATLVEEVCLATIDGGACSLNRQNYSVELNDPSGGCHEWQEEFLCEDLVANAGQPVASPTQESGSELDLSQCAAFTNDLPPVTNSASGSIHNFVLETPVESSWIRIENNSWLHLAEVKIWGTNAAGTLRQITNAHRSELVVTQRGTYQGNQNYAASRVVDNDVNTFNHSATAQSPWLKIAFPEGYTLTRVEIINRQNYDAGRLNGAVISYERNGRLCQITSQTCVEGPETRVINGASVTKSCWKWDYNYECSNRTDVNTCEPQETAELEESVCAFTDRAGNCTLFDKVYVNEEHDPSGGCDQYRSEYQCEEQVAGLTHFDTNKIITREYWDPQPFFDMNAEWDSCTYTGVARAGERETREHEGLTLRRIWDYTWDYDCYNRTPVDTCDFGPGAIEVSSSCAQEYNGACVRDAFVYDVPIEDNSNGCEEYTTNFKCLNEVAGLTPYTEFKSIESNKWDWAACNEAREPYNACVLDTAVCAEGRETRTIDGLEVTQNCWAQERTYTCDEIERFDTCAVPPTALEHEVSCAWEDRTGTCRLFEHNYDVLLPDPTGGCTIYLDEYLCEETVSGPDLIDTFKHVDTEVWNESACVTEDEVGTCTAATTCSEAGDTRLIDGLEVTRNCWERTRANTCFVRDTYNECLSLAEYGPPAEECLWTDSEGVCRLTENTFSVPVDDGSDGCHVWENSYWCPQQVGDLEYSEHAITLTSTAYDNDACNAVSSLADFYHVDTVCSERNPKNRVPDDIRHREGGHDLVVGPLTTVSTVHANCWQQTRSYTQEIPERVNTCVGQINAQCTLTETDCEQTGYETDECSLENVTYSCGIDGSDYCEVEENLFTCVGPAVASSAQLSNLNGDLAMYEPVEIFADVVSAAFDNEACSQATTFGTCTLTATNCLDDGTQGPRQVERAQDEYYQQFVAYAPLQFEQCWEQELVYDCGQPSGAAYCGDEADSCSFESSNCLHEDDAGNCLMSVSSFTCETDGGGVCSETSQGYVCENPVEGYDPDGTTEPTVSSSYDMSACDNIEQTEAYCSEPTVTCTDPTSVRYYEPSTNNQEISAFGLEPTETSVAVSSECFEYENSYECSQVGDAATDCDPPEGCVQTGENCLGQNAEGECVTTEFVYECVSTEEVVLQEGTPGTCEPLDDDEPAASPPANEVSALSALLSVAQADRETGDSEFTIFEGQEKKCGRDVLGLKNCCKSSGVLISIGLGQCSDEEFELSVQKEQDRCVSLGSYCSKKAFFGTCLKKKQSYCCYEAEISRIVAEAGRQQLNRDFGTPKNPECGGFSVTEFQQLDLSQVDFSSISADIMGTMSDQDTSQFTDSIQDRLNDMTGGGG